MNSWNRYADFTGTGLSLERVPDGVEKLFSVTWSQIIENSPLQLKEKDRIPVSLRTGLTYCRFYGGIVTSN